MATARLTVCALLVAAVVTGCTSTRSGSGGGSGAGKYDADPQTLSIIAGSEQDAVIANLVKPWCASHKYTCNFTSKGSVDQARLLAAGSADYDAYWFASSVFLQVGDSAGALQDVKPMFLTPVVFAAWRDEMAKLGFGGRTDVTIDDIGKAIDSGQTRVWITNPTQSNSGATVLFGFMNKFAGNPPGTALTAEQLDSAQVEQGISRFVKAMDQTPPSTGALMNDCAAHTDTCRSMFTYEALVIEKNQELVKAGKQPLVVAYPRGALAVSDAPLGFFPHKNDADAGKRRALNELQDYLLKDPTAQAKLLQLGRRPAGGIGLSLDNADPAVFNPDWGIQSKINEQPIQYPSATVIQNALDRYQTRYRKPVDVYYCLDGSGSMAGNHGWEGIQAASHQVFDADQAAVNLLQTNPEDITNVAIFNDGTAGGSPWQVTGNDPAALHGLTEHIVGYRPGGGTDMYTCLSSAAKELTRPATGDRKRLVVLMTDGQSETRNRGTALAALTAAHIPVIAIAFGSQTDKAQLTEVASATGGSFVAQDDLVMALRQAAGYK